MIDPDSAAKAREINEYFKKEYDFELMQSQLEYIAAALEAERKAGREEEVRERLGNFLEAKIADARQAAWGEAIKACHEVVDQKIGIHGQVEAYILGHSGGAYACADQIRRLGEKA